MIGRFKAFNISLGIEGLQRVKKQFVFPFEGFFDVFKWLDEVKLVH
jgi:hypothetical protein